MANQEDEWKLSRWVKIAERQPDPCKAVAAKQRGHYFQLYRLSSGEIKVSERQKYRDVAQLEELSPGVEWLEESKT